MVIASLGCVARAFKHAPIISILLLFFAAPAEAEPPCVHSCIGLQLSDGLSIGGTGSPAHWRLASLLFSARTEMAMSEEPRVGMLGGLAIEIGGRLGVGAELGLRARPASGAHTRFGAVAQYMFAPYTLLGAGFEAGACPWRLRALGGMLCMDVRGTAHFAGDDLPEGHIVTRLDLVIGAEFNGF